MISTYEDALQKSRLGLVRDMTKRTENVCRKRWMNYLLWYCGQGIHMTEPVPDWMRRAGAKAVLLGDLEEGKLLGAHASGEEGHHLLLEKDLARLYQFARENSLTTTELERFRNAELSSIVEYKNMHEHWIDSDWPLVQLAIEYEIELLSLSLGPRATKHFEQVLGGGVARMMTFLELHVNVDVDHVEHGRVAMQRLLDRRPEYLERLIEGGRESLRIYKEYLEGCWTLAQSVPET